MPKTQKVSKILNFFKNLKSKQKIKINKTRKILQKIQEVDISMYYI